MTNRHLATTKLTLEKQYQLEFAVYKHCITMSPDEVQAMLTLARMFFTPDALETVENALRDSAYYPET